jgi:hypothetical protein
MAGFRHGRDVWSVTAITEDVVVTKFFMNPAEWGLYALCVMQVCAYGETPPERIEQRANELNPPGSSAPWQIIWGNGDEGDVLNGPNKAPIPCQDDPARLHYLLSC